MQRTFTSPVVLAIVLIVAGVVAVPGPAVAQRATPAQQRIIDRILELQREIDRLVAQLPPALRDQVHENLARQTEASGGLSVTTAARTARGAAIRIWIDTGAGGTISPGEVTTAVDSAVREIDVGLRMFVRRDGTAGSVRRADRIELDLKGDGFRSAVGILCLDIDAIAEMGFEIRSEGGQRLRGVLPLQAGWRVRGPDGTEVVLV